MDNFRGVEISESRPIEWAKKKRVELRGSLLMVPRYKTHLATAGKPFKKLRVGHPSMTLSACHRVTLFLAKRAGWFDSGGAKCGDYAGQQRYSGEQGGYGGVGEWVVGRYAVDKAGDDAA